MNNTDADDPPIKLIRRKLGCSNRLIEVFLDDIQEHGRPPVLDYIVVVPRQSDEDHVTGVSILPVLDGNFGLLNIYRHPIRDFVWEVPRGFVDPGESAATSALRELKEETGLQCETRNLIDLGIALPEPGVITARTQLFAAMNCRRVGPYEPAEMGHKELVFFSTEEIENMAVLGLIQDANTLAALFRYSLSQARRSDFATGT